MYKNSAELLKFAKQVIPGGCSTESKRTETLFASEQAPAFFKSADGVEIVDVDGNTFIDFGMALGPCILGYNHPVVVEAIEKALINGILSTLPSSLEPQLAELMIEIFPSIEMVRFMKTGAEACSAAVRLARAFTNREYILASGYFGWHDWSNTGAGVPASTKNLCIEFAFNDSADFLNQLNALPELPAAVVMEPVIKQHPQQEFLKIIRESCDRSGIVLIWDEIKTGARLEPGGAQQYYDFTADLTVLGKGIAGGMPLAAVGGKREIMKTWEKVWISSTFACESLSIAVALAVLKFIQDNPVSTHIEKLGTRLLNGFQKISEAFPGLCSVFGIPLEAAFFHETLSSGFIIKRHGYNFVSYAHTEEHIDGCLKCAHSAFKKINQV
jgi:glutamate-1-semialdehyde 2,1-aminomutase